jgi:signal transduction histidine kinase
VGTVGIFTDIREKLEMEQSLALAQEQLEARRRTDAITEVAGAAAHELNQPLTSVMGYAEYLKRRIQDDEPLTHAIEVILVETQRMADIVRKVGRITRYETKPYVGGAKIVDLDASTDSQEGENADPAPESATNATGAGRASD